VACQSSRVRNCWEDVGHALERTGEIAERCLAGCTTAILQSLCMARWVPVMVVVANAGRCSYTGSLGGTKGADGRIATAWRHGPCSELSVILCSASTSTSWRGNFVCRKIFVNSKCTVRASHREEVDDHDDGRTQGKVRAVRTRPGHRVMSDRPVFEFKCGRLLIDPVLI
jgi:hypothetical protein